MHQIGLKRFRNEDRQRVFDKTGNRCFYCGVVLTYQNRSIDHIMPLSKGGTDDMYNLIGACKSCNNRKKDHTIEEFRVLQSRFNQKTIYLTPEQRAFLESYGFTEHLPKLELFWWEKQPEELK